MPRGLVYVCARHNARADRQGVPCRLPDRHVDRNRFHLLTDAVLSRGLTRSSEGEGVCCEGEGVCACDTSTTRRAHRCREAVCTCIATDTRHVSTAWLARGLAGAYNKRPHGDLHVCYNRRSCLSGRGATASLRMLHMHRHTRSRNTRGGNDTLLQPLKVAVNATAAQTPLLRLRCSPGLPANPGNNTAGAAAGAIKFALVAADITRGRAQSGRRGLGRGPTPA